MERGGYQFGGESAGICLGDLLPAYPGGGSDLRAKPGKDGFRASRGGAGWKRPGCDGNGHAECGSVDRSDLGAVVPGDHFPFAAACGGYAGSNSCCGKQCRRRAGVIFVSQIDISASTIMPCILTF